jgi:hypothetical protein
MAERLIQRRDSSQCGWRKSDDGAGLVGMRGCNIQREDGSHRMAEQVPRPVVEGSQCFHDCPALLLNRESQLAVGITPAREVKKNPVGPFGERGARVELAERTPGTGRTVQKDPRG